MTKAEKIYRKNRNRILISNDWVGLSGKIVGFDNQHLIIALITRIDGAGWNSSLYPESIFDDHINPHGYFFISQNGSFHICNFKFGRRNRI